MKKIIFILSWVVLYCHQSVFDFPMYNFCYNNVSYYFTIKHFSAIVMLVVGLSKYVLNNNKKKEIEDKNNVLREKNNQYEAEKRKLEEKFKLLQEEQNKEINDLVAKNQTLQQQFDSIQYKYQDALNTCKKKVEEAYSTILAQNIKYNNSMHKQHADAYNTLIIGLQNGQLAIQEALANISHDIKSFSKNWNEEEAQKKEIERLFKAKHVPEIRHVKNYLLNFYQGIDKSTKLITEQNTQKFFDEYEASLSCEVGIVTNILKEGDLPVDDVPYLIHCLDASSKQYLKVALECAAKQGTLTVDKQYYKKNYLCYQPSYTEFKKLITHCQEYFSKYFDDTFKYLDDDFILKVKKGARSILLIPGKTQSEKELFFIIRELLSNKITIEDFLNELDCLKDDFSTRIKQYLGDNNNDKDFYMSVLKNELCQYFNKKMSLQNSIIWEQFFGDTADEAILLYCIFSHTVLPFIQSPEGIVNYIIEKNNSEIEKNKNNIEKNNSEIEKNNNKRVVRWRSCKSSYSILESRHGINPLFSNFFYVMKEDFYDKTEEKCSEDSMYLKKIYNLKDLINHDTSFEDIFNLLADVFRYNRQVNPYYMHDTKIFNALLEQIKNSFIVLPKSSINFIDPLERIKKDHLFSEITNIEQTIEGKPTHYDLIDTMSDQYFDIKRDSDLEILSNFAHIVPDTYQHILSNQQLFDSTDLKHLRAVWKKVISYREFKNREKWKMEVAAYAIKHVKSISKEGGNVEKSYSYHWSQSEINLMNKINNDQLLGILYNQGFRNCYVKWDQVANAYQVINNKYKEYHPKALNEKSHPELDALKSYENVSSSQVFHNQQAILLWGSPGNGKTALIENMIYAMPQVDGAYVYDVDCATLFHESEFYGKKMMHKDFIKDVISNYIESLLVERNKGKSLFFMLRLDEVEKIAFQRSFNNADQNTSYLIVFLDDIHKYFHDLLKNEKVKSLKIHIAGRVCMTTNCNDTLLDTAVTSRCAYSHEITSPDVGIIDAMIKELNPGSDEREIGLYTILMYNRACRESKMHLTVLSLKNNMKDDDIKKLALYCRYVFWFFQCSRRELTSLLQAVKSFNVAKIDLINKIFASDIRTCKQTSYSWEFDSENFVKDTILKFLCQLSIDKLLENKSDCIAKINHIKAMQAYSRQRNDAGPKFAIYFKITDYKKSNNQEKFSNLRADIESLLNDGINCNGDKNGITIEWCDSANKPINFSLGSRDNSLIERRNVFAKNNELNRNRLCSSVSKRRQLCRVSSV
jgi:hypothetical protein